MAINYGNLTGEFQLPLITLQIAVTISAVLSFVSLPINIYVLYITYVNRDMRLPSHYGLINLSIANIILAILYPVPPVFVLITYNSPLQYSPILILILCAIIMPLPMSALLVINGTLAYIAIEKYLFATG